MGPSDLLRALGIPASWHFFLLSLGAMLALAGLDFAGPCSPKNGSRIGSRRGFLPA